jgi:hypothetical protein
MTMHATPRRSAAVAPARSQVPDVLFVEDNVYCLTADEGILGFIEKVGNVFVALSGPKYANAVEVGQSLSFDEAVIMAQRASRTSR